MGQLAERHGHELGPAGEPLGGAFGQMFLDQRRKFCPGEMLQKLIEQAGSLYHENALLQGVMEPIQTNDSLTTMTGGHTPLQMRSNRRMAVRVYGRYRLIASLPACRPLRLMR